VVEGKKAKASNAGGAVSDLLAAASLLRHDFLGVNVNFDGSWTQSKFTAPDCTLS
jgi:hypothetical protein